MLRTFQSTLRPGVDSGSALCPLSTLSWHVRRRPVDHKPMRGFIHHTLSMNPRSGSAWISVDHCGSGYSSLLSAQSRPVDYKLKSSVPLCSGPKVAEKSPKVAESYRVHSELRTNCHSSQTTSSTQVKRPNRYSGQDSRSPHPPTTGSNSKRTLCALFLSSRHMCRLPSLSRFYYKTPGFMELVVVGMESA